MATKFRRVAGARQLAFFTPDPTPAASACVCSPTWPRITCGHCTHCDTCLDCDACAGRGCTCECEDD